MIFGEVSYRLCASSHVARPRLAGSHAERDDGSSRGLARWSRCDAAVESSSPVIQVSGPHFGSNRLLTPDF